MRIFMRIMLYLSFLWLALVYLFFVSAKDKWVYIELGLMVLFTLILSFLLFFFFFRQNKKSYKNLAIILFLLPCITFIINCMPQEKEMGLDDYYDEKTLVTYYLILEQGLDFYFLNIVVFLIGLIIYLYQAHLQKNIISKP